MTRSRHARGSALVHAGLACLLLACRPAPPLPPEPAGPPPVHVEAETMKAEGELVGELVIAGNAWLHARPDSAIRFRLTARDQALPEKEGVRFAVVEVSEDWVERDAVTPGEACKLEGARLGQVEALIDVGHTASIGISSAETQVRLPGRTPRRRGRGVASPCRRSPPGGFGAWLDR